MIDYIISEEGQRAFGRGGLTPARPGIKPGDGIRHTYSSIAEAVGEAEHLLYRLRPGRACGITTPSWRAGNKPSMSPDPGGALDIRQQRMPCRNPCPAATRPFSTAWRC